MHVPLMPALVVQVLDVLGAGRVQHLKVISEVSPDGFGGVKHEPECLQRQSNGLLR